MNARHRRTLTAIFERPTRADVRWSDVEALVRALGGEVSQGSGSRVRLVLNGVRGVFHRPHPRPVTDKGALASLRMFLENAGTTP
ncbi:MAG: type II toxin-antitoxin system HicA family toxin [Alphaproteobacteria bacterium]